MPRGNIQWSTSSAEDDAWYRMFIQVSTAERTGRCPECGAREGYEHRTVHRGGDLPCGGWRRPCSLGNTLTTKGEA